MEQVNDYIISTYLPNIFAQVIPNVHLMTRFLYFLLQKHNKLNRFGNNKKVTKSTNNKGKTLTDLTVTFWRSIVPCISEGTSILQYFFSVYLAGIKLSRILNPCRSDINQINTFSDQQI